MPSKIEWCDETINPLGWGCYGPEGTAENPKPCTYCYARRMALRGMTKCDLCNKFVPHRHPEHLGLLTKWKKPKKIFVQSMGDLFHEDIPDEWVEQVFNACDAAPQHQYLFLTKNPLRYGDLNDGKGVPDKPNFWYGSTATKEGDKIACVKTPRFRRSNFFVSIEPLLQDVQDLSALAYLDWVIVGAQTGPGAIKPKPEWVERIIEQCRAADVPLFLKDNLMWPEKIQEFPRRINLGE